MSLSSFGLKGAFFAFQPLPNQLNKQLLGLKSCKLTETTNMLNTVNHNINQVLTYSPSHIIFHTALLHNLSRFAVNRAKNLFQTAGNITRLIINLQICTISAAHLKISFHRQK